MQSSGECLRWGYGWLLIEHHSMPEFEAEQIPEPVSVVEATGCMFIDKLSHGSRSQESPIETATGQQHIAQERLQGITKPVIDGYTETHLGTVAKRFRQEFLKGINEDDFGTSQRLFPFDRHASRQFNHFGIEERTATFQRSCHAGDIHFGENITGKVGLNIDGCRASNETTAGISRPCLMNEIRRVEVVENFFEHGPGKPVQLYAIEDGDPVEIPPLGCFRESFGKPLQSADKRPLFDTSGDSAD